MQMPMVRTLKLREGKEVVARTTEAKAKARNSIIVVKNSVKEDIYIIIILLFSPGMVCMTRLL